MLELMEHRVVPSLVNGGFETGDFSGWTLSGNTDYCGVSFFVPHSGTYAAEMGPVMTEGFIAQTVATVPGVFYALDYWLQNDGGTPNSFRAMINGVNVPGSVITNGPASSYTEHTFIIQATGPTTEVKFGFRDDPAFWHLDDVSFEPAHVLVPAVVSTSLTGTVNGPVIDDLVTFNEPVDPSTFTPDQFVLTDPNGNPVNVTGITTTDDTTFDISFDPQTAAGTYAVSVGPNIADFAGTPMAGPYTMQFTVAGSASNLLVNGDFETGDLTGWLQSGDTDNTGVDGGLPHSGNFAAYLGPVGSEGFLAQAFPTTPGATYTLGYWLEHDGGAPSSFRAMIDGGDLAGSVFVDDPGFAYTEFAFGFTATGSTTTLTFGFREDVSLWHLDDVSVVPGPAPAPHGGPGDHTPFDVAFPPGALESARPGAAAAAPAAELTTRPANQTLRRGPAALVDQVFPGPVLEDAAVAAPRQPRGPWTEVDALGWERLASELGSL
jgi:hypothetical protein